MAESGNNKTAVNAEWIYDTPVHSNVEAKLRKLLVDLGNDDKILGIQVCAYKDGEVIIDTAAGVLGVDDPRPVQLDSLFNVFSVTKGITAGMMHWLVDKGSIMCYPSGVESRLAVLTTDIDDVKMLTTTGVPDMTADDIHQLFTLAKLCNTQNIRCAIIPAANRHCSARALARYYATLVDGGIIPPPHSGLSKPPLGSERSGSKGSKIFSNPRIHDQFLGVGDYENLVLLDGTFGLGFRRYKSTEDGPNVGFGHSGMGGSIGYCVMKERFAIAVTVNKLSRGTTTGKIIHFVCSELNLPIPEQYMVMVFGEKGADDLGRAVIN